MLKHLTKINNISIYVDDYMEDNKILKGRKGSTLEEMSLGIMKQKEFMVCNSKTAKIFIIMLRKEKLNRILNEK